MPVVISTVSPPPAANGKRALAVWNSEYNLPSVTASGSAAGFPALNTLDPATATSWRGVAATSWIYYDYGSAVSVSAVGIAAHNMATSGVTSVEVQRSANGTSWTTIATYDPLTNEDVIFTFAAQSYRYWRVATFGAVCNIGYIAAGAALVFPSAPIDSYKPLQLSREYRKLFNNSITGQLLGNRVMGAGANTTVDFGFVDRDFPLLQAATFIDHYNRGGTFFYAAAPSVYPREMGYCWADSQDAIVDVTYIEGIELASLSFGVSAYVAS